MRLVGRCLAVVFASGVVLCASGARAGEAVVKASTTVVRSAPFEVAPELVRLHAGERLPADDRPQGAWRRVRLPDGRFGLVHDADLEITVNAPPTAPVNAATTPPPPATAAPPPPGYAPPAGYAPYGYPPPGYVYRPGPGFQTHDGTYVRLHLGAGYTNMTADGGLGGTFKLHGASTSLGVAVGGVVAPSFIVYGALTLATISDPTAEVGGTSGTIPNFTASVRALGAGAAYYLEPDNVYFAGTLLAAQLVVDDTSDNSGSSQMGSNVGLGFEGLVGKEWWASDNWGLGVAGQVMLSTMKDGGAAGLPNPTWTIYSFGLLFSATYN